MRRFSARSIATLMFVVGLSGIGSLATADVSPEREIDGFFGCQVCYGAPAGNMQPGSYSCHPELDCITCGSWPAGGNVPFNDTLPVNAVVTNILAHITLQRGRPVGEICANYSPFFIQCSVNGVELAWLNYGRQDSNCAQWDTYPFGQLSFPSASYHNNGQQNVFNIFVHGNVCVQTVSLTFTYTIVQPPPPPLPDNDADGVANVNDNCPNRYNPSQTNSDSDNVGDVCDNCVLIANNSQVDSDSDRVGDACDNCPSVANRDQADADDDDQGDLCDNCPDDVNPDQEDTDNDGDGNACDDACEDATEERSLLLFGFSNMRYGLPERGCERWKVFIPTRDPGELCIQAYSAAGPLEIFDSATPAGEEFGEPSEPGHEPLVKCVMTTGRGYYVFDLHNAPFGHSVIATFHTKGRASRRPWNYFWWPAAQDRISSADAVRHTTIDSAHGVDDRYQWQIMDSPSLCPPNVGMQPPMPPPMPLCPVGSNMCPATLSSPAKPCPYVTPPPADPLYITPYEDSGLATDNVRGYIFAGANGTLDTQPGNGDSVFVTPNLFDSSGALWKFDTINAGTAHPTTAQAEEMSFTAASWNGNQRQRECGCANPHYCQWAPKWAGHCYQMALVSSAIGCQPVPRVFQVLGQAQLTTDELEGLWGEAALSVPAVAPCPPYTAVLEYCPPGPPVPGNSGPSGLDLTDSSVPAIHDALHRVIGRERKHLLADLREQGLGDPTAVWNHIIYSFDAEWEQNIPLGGSRSSRTNPTSPSSYVTIDATVRSNDDFAPPSSNAADGDHPECLLAPCYYASDTCQARGCDGNSVPQSCNGIVWNDRVEEWTYAIQFNELGDVESRYADFKSASHYAPKYLRENVHIYWPASEKVWLSSNMQVLHDYVTPLDANNWHPEVGCDAYRRQIRDPDRNRNP